LNEDASERTAKYLEATSMALKRMKTRNLPATVLEARLEYVLELVRSYIKDSQHYAENKKPVTSLACIAYAEGLLDAAKFLDLVEF
jgi:FAD synthetase